MRQNLEFIIADAARKAFSELFRTIAEDFYYCSLITTGEGLTPYPCAWSWQALERATAQAAAPEKARNWLKWSYADSPYWLFGESYFAPVLAQFLARPDPHSLNASHDFLREMQFRLAAMESAMRQLDQEGLFDFDGKRAERVILVEVMPPDESNTERALRLNRPSPGLARWLAEAAE